MSYAEYADGRTSGFTAPEARKSSAAHSSLTGVLRFDGELARGIGGGLMGGFWMAVLTMWFMVGQHVPLKLSILMVSTIVQGAGSMVQGTASPVVGALVHLALSLVFGVIFTIAARRLRTNGGVVLAGVFYGIALYAMDFGIFARLFFPVMTRVDQPFELLVHLVYGLVLSLLFLGSGIRRGEPVFAMVMPRPSARHSRQRIDDESLLDLPLATTAEDGAVVREDHLASAETPSTAPGGNVLAPEGDSRTEKQEMTDEQIKAARQLYATHAYSITQIAAIFDVPWPTVYLHLTTPATTAGDH